MKTLVVYDSQYGNTEKVGMAIGDAIPEAKVFHANKARAHVLSALIFLIAIWSQRRHLLC
jgi:flavodoxin